MEMNLDPGRNETVINLRGPCKLDIMRDDSTITTVEVPLGKVYRLVVKGKEAKRAKEII